MIGTFVIVLLIASILVLCGAFLMVMLWMGKSFNQMGNQAPPPDQQHHRPENS